MSDIAYHYCSMETFNSIMKNKSLRLSDITKSNDSHEKTVIFKHMKSAIDEAFAYMKLPVKATDRIGSATNSNEFASEYTYLEYFTRELNENISQLSLVICFSGNGDLLSQWRGYADDGCGFSIGFDVDLLKKYIRDDERFELSNIVYDEPSQIALIKYGVLSVFNDYAVYFINNKLDHSENIAIYDDIIDDIAYDLVEEFGVVSCLMKDDSFKEEQEIRLVFSTQIGFDSEYYEIDKKIHGTTKLLMKDIDFYNRDSQFVPFVDLVLTGKALSDGLIKEIIIGPKVNMSVEEVLFYLESRNIDCSKIDVRKSTISYR